MLDLSGSQPIDNPSTVAARGGVLSETGEWRGQSVFVKTLLTANTDIRERFGHEGQIAAMLDHPLVVPLLARTPTQLLFPFIPGGTLRDLALCGPMSADEASAVAMGVLHATAHLHSRGVTHQDLKPENVLLMRGPVQAASVRVIDFGMSHARTLPLDIHSGTRMGTPHFMAPEQFKGVRGDPRSDLYSVAVLMFDCLAGHPPYEDALGWLVGIHERRAALPGPSELHPVMLAALDRDPDGRPDSAAEMLRQLCAVRCQLGFSTSGPYETALIEGNPVGEIA
ncbi:MAG: serine/threonine protein kinase [Deinococcus sp.]|nr:serine/threonine protein kinase [Deinococcus sp.]